MDCEIRHIDEREWPLLEDFLYEAIYVPEGFEGEVPRSVIYDDPKCRAAYLGFGTLPDDRAVVAEVDGVVVGACWVRTTDEYGRIDDSTPSFSISLYKQYRNLGVGTAMMSRMLDELRASGYARTSLSVQKQNPALRLYERLGFRIVGDGFDETEWLMVADLSTGDVRTAGMLDVDAVHAMVQHTIRAIYPGFYEPAVVEAFCRLHSRDAIASDVAMGKVFLFDEDGIPVGTGTLDGCHVKRVFVLPARQGCGIGTSVMNALESLASSSYGIVTLDSSRPAERFYLNRDYRVVSEGAWEIAAVDEFLATTLKYKVMEKRFN